MFRFTYPPREASSSTRPRSLSFWYGETHSRAHNQLSWLSQLPEGERARSQRSHSHLADSSDLNASFSSMLLLRLGSFLGLLVDLRLASTLPSYPLIARSSRSPLGNKIPLIENLGAAEDQYDVLDLSDNEITRVDGFPRMNRLTSLMLNNNRIASVADGLADNIPNLETLILTNNKIQNLADLDPIAELKNLHTVSFMKNEVCLKPHYRLYLIHLLPSVKIIDFRKVKYQVLLRFNLL